MAKDPSEMTNLNRARRSYARENLSKAMEGNLVSDVETQQFQQQAQAGAQAGIRAQQAQLAEQAAAQQSGSLNQQALTQATQQASQKAGDAAIQASGQAAQFKEAAERSRRAEALGQADTQIAEDARRRQAAMSHVFNFFDVAGSQGAIVGEAMGGMMGGM
jgi:hypothetical protein